MRTATHPGGPLLGSRRGVVRRSRPNVPLLAATAGVVSALASVALVSASATWGLTPARQVPVDATVGLTFSVMAAVVLTSSGLRRGSRTLAWVLMLAGVCSGVAALSTAVSLTATSTTGWAQAAVQVQGMVWVPGFVPLLTLVPLLYPDGLLPGAPWRWAAAAATVGTATMTIGVGLFPEPFAGQVAIAKPVSNLAVAQALSVLSAVLLLPATLVALASPLVRLRRSSGLQRRQVVVVLVPAVLLAVVTAVQSALPTPVDVVAQSVAAGLVAVALGVAVTRHGLYELDTAVARALVAASLAVCLAGAYLTMFALLQALPQHRSALSAALAAGTTGMVMLPLSRRLQVGVDRMFYGDSADPFAVTTKVGGRLAATGLDVTHVPQVVCDTLVEALRLPAARVTLTVDGRPRQVATSGDAAPTAPHSAIDLRHGGEVVGELVVWSRPGERTLRERDVVVVRSVADQVSPAVAALRLHQQLQASREALVAARENERLRLRRDLHDGLGATLAGLRLQIETAQDITSEAPVEGLLVSAADGVAQAVHEVRAITEGLRPAGIDDLGLPRALEALADRLRTPGLDIRVDVGARLRTDPAVEVALYRIAAEALANVVRHSRASTAVLTVHDDQRITLDVTDNGTGLTGRTDTAGSGLGLASMRQRAEEIGGSLALASSPAGTTVRAVLPHSVGDLP